MTASPWRVYEKAKERLGAGEIDFDSDTLKVALFTNSSNASVITLDDYGDLSGEVANANGYTAGGETLANVTWSPAGGGETMTLDADDVQWTASGGNITARYAVIYDDSHADKALLAYCVLDTLATDVTVTDGNNLTIQMNASGIITLSGATS